VSFKFQFFHGIPNVNGNFNNIISYFLGQAAAMGLFLGIICIILPYINIFSDSEEKKFLSTFSLVPLTIFAITSYKSLAEMNWPICSYPSIAVLGAIFFVELSGMRITSLSETSYSKPSKLMVNKLP
jgi:bacteriorhodopsin